MDSNTNPVSYDLRMEDGLWKLFLNRDDQTPDLPKPGTNRDGNQDLGLIWIGTAIGPKGLTRKEAMEIVRSVFPSRSWARTLTVAEFVETRFVPRYVATRSVSSRIYYRSILKHIVDPDLVDRAFGAEGQREGARGRFVSGWPYLGNFSLDDVQPDSVRDIVTAALNHGYSIYTVSHIRNAICTIFTFAAKEGDFSGPNPGRLFKWSSLRQKSSLLRPSGPRPSVPSSPA